MSRRKRRETLRDVADHLAVALGCLTLEEVDRIHRALLEVARTQREVSSRYVLECAESLVALEAEGESRGSPDERLFFSIASSLLRDIAATVQHVDYHWEPSQGERKEH